VLANIAALAICARPDWQAAGIETDLDTVCAPLLNGLADHTPVARL
jgi:hypothetical protein